MAHPVTLGIYPRMRDGLRPPPAKRLLAVIVALLSAGAATAQEFHPPVPYELSGSDPTDIAVADFNGDGLPDVALAMAGVAGGDGKVSVLLGDGAGGLSDHPFPVNYRPWGIAAADLNGDALADLVVTEGSETGTRLFIHHAAGDGFAPPVAVAGGGSYPAAVAVGDLNEDGHHDLAAANALRPGLSIVPAVNGDAFGPPINIAEAAWATGHDITLADLDGDGHLDVVLPQAALRGDGRGGFSLLRSLGGTVAAAVADFTADGVPDVVVIQNQSLQLWAGRHDGGGYFLDYLSASALEGEPQAMAVADLNSDGLPDVAVTTRAPDRLLLLAGRGGLFEPLPSLAVGTEPGPVAAADWNGDGYPDLAVGCRNRGDTPSLDLLLQAPQPGASGTLRFARSEYRFLESAGAGAVSVLRVGGSAGELTADYATIAGTAASGGDYIPATGRLTLADAVLATTIPIALVDDSLPEPDEWFELQLATKPPTVARIVIVDDDAAPADPGNGSVGDPSGGGTTPDVDGNPSSADAGTGGGGGGALSGGWVLIAALLGRRARPNRSRCV